MNRTLPLVLVLLLLATGCVTTIQPTAIPVGPNVTVAPQAQNTAANQQPAAPSSCQSKLLGRLADANGAVIKGAVVQVSSGKFNAKTLSDDNGLYGFAGLCAGTYAFAVTVPGKSPKALSTTSTLDGANTVRTDLTAQ